MLIYREATGGKASKLSSNKQAVRVKFSPTDNSRLVSLCGPCNENLQQIENHFKVEITQRSNIFYISGNSKQPVDSAKNVLYTLYDKTADHKDLTPEQIHALLTNNLVHNKENNPMNETTLYTRFKSIQARNINQQKYIQNIENHDINFAIGPAGTGKTYLAVACAVDALEKNKVKRIIFVRPAVEAGEKLGFLPGDMEEKVLPYLKPLYDALYEMLGFDYAKKLIEQDIIEIAPIAFMRGRTLNNAYIILDEAQNTTSSQMKMFLTRLGFGSTAIITGDVTQIDLPHGTKSGLVHAQEIFNHTPEISFSLFGAKDAVRHQLVTTIIETYEKHDKT